MIELINKINFIKVGIMNILNKKQNNKAFTIIEVVLVLAVAGLIFLVVFAAVPRLQASRRDNQRKSDLRLFMAELENFRSNSGGSRTTQGTYAAAVYYNDYPFVNDAGAASTYGINDFCNDYMYFGNGVNGDHDWKEPSTGNGYDCIWSAATPSEYDEVRISWYYVCTPSGGYAAATPADYSIVSARINLERGSYCLDTSSS